MIELVIQGNWMNKGGWANLMVDGCIVASIWQSDYIVKAYTRGSRYMLYPKDYPHHVFIHVGKIRKEQNEKVHS